MVLDLACILTKKSMCFPAYMGSGRGNSRGLGGWVVVAGKA